ncbi:Ger(x)C family spore germination protein [Geomicrobium sp. JSM 1781026]|uniref:Ger(x)C family spore germination protein n=1 Tax=Geomicrobium sp. JSM 1781026 TaxID=3344580 RepID=UPI0035C1C8CE
MLTKNTFIVLLLLASVLLTGCWDQWELRDLSVVTGLAIDKGENDEFILTMQVINPSEIAAQEEGSGFTAAQNYETRASSIQEGFRKLTQQAPRRGYFSHIAALIISEEVASEGLSNFLDHFYRDHEIRSDFFLLIARGESASDILSLLPPIEELTSVNLKHSLLYSENSYTAVKGVTLDDLFEDLAARGIDPVMEGVSTSGDVATGKSIENRESVKPSAYLYVGHSGFFKADRFVGWLDEDEVKGYNYVMSENQDTPETLSCPDDGTFVLETQSIEPNIIVHSGNSPKINIDIKIHSTLSEMNCEGIDVEKKESKQLMEGIMNDEVEALVNIAIQKSKEERVDIFGLGREVYRQKPRLWEELKSEWYTHLAEIPVHVNVNTEVVGSGDVNNTFNVRDYIDGD